jgi:hypothetical protein
MNHETAIPRRNRLDLWVPAELAISDAMRAVEAAGAHPRLTDAVVLLGQAQNAVADFVDGVTRPTATDTMPRAGEPETDNDAEWEAVLASAGPEKLAAMEARVRTDVPCVYCIFDAEGRRVRACPAHIAETLKVATPLPASAPREGVEPDAPVVPMSERDGSDIAHILDLLAEDHPFDAGHRVMREAATRLRASAPSRPASEPVACAG